MTIHESALRGGRRGSQGLRDIPALYGDGSAAGRAVDRPRDEVDHLVDQAKAGDIDAFSELFRNHYTSIYRLARFYAAGADELAADTFTRAWADLELYRPGTSFSSWLYEIARVVVADARHATLRAALAEPDPDLYVEPNPDPRALIAPLVALLPEEQRQVIEMKYLVGMSDPEVAECFKKGIETVDELRWKAIMTLQGFMDQDR